MHARCVVQRQKGDSERSLSLVGVMAAMLISVVSAFVCQ